MNGYQLTFYTQQNRKHNGKPVAEWLFETAKELNVAGATLSNASEGFGHGGKVHSAHFFDLSDQPVIISMVISAQDKQKLLAILEHEKANIFYVATEAEFGLISAEK